MRKQKEKFRNIVNIYAFKNGMKKSKTMGVKYIQSNCNIKSDIQFSSVAQLCPNFCDPMNHSTPVLPVHDQLLESTQTRVH